MVVSLRIMVTFLSVPSHPIVPPKASIIALMGTRVLLFLITGLVPCSSIDLASLLILILGFPI